MNYVILNGVKSTTIKGLLIQSLPPISKPLMRTQVEEIDGRDGDIVTQLGYSAYDKNISIGLYGDYDVDDVISYFNSSGTVIFSNEPDKYYNYQIIKQIDFERLIRFKTATVTFHVQPFKYSAVENTYQVTNEYINIPDYSAVKNGITITAKNGGLSIIGTGATATEFYVPIQSTTLSNNTYKLSLSSLGSGASACSIRLITTSPSNANSFGGNYVTLKDNGTVTLSGQSTATYNYLWFYIAANTAMNFDLTANLGATTFDSVTVKNAGNTVSKPAITIYGTGTINLSLNGSQIFVINLGAAEYVTIDSAQMNAYQSGILMNRSVIGDYDSLALNIGTNTLTWTGTVTSIEIVNFSRWL